MQDALGFGEEDIDIIGLGDVPAADEMVRNKRLFFGGGLCGADFKPPVDLHGVAADDFRIALACNG